MLNSKRLRIKQVIYYNNPTLFCVGKEGQKRVYDKTYGKYLAYSSGQQQKTTRVNEVCELLGIPLADFVFYYNEKHKQASKGISQDPRHVEAMTRGYMNVTTNNIKRESPLNISTMFPIHPLLVESIDDLIAVGHGVREKSFTLIQEKKKTKKAGEDDDESEKSDGSKTEGKYEEVPKTTDEYKKFLDEMADTRKKGIEHSLAGGKLLTRGVFERYIEIDLTRLFAFNNDILLPSKEIAAEYMDAIIKDGWKEVDTKLYGKMFIVPKSIRDKYIPAIAEALVMALPNTNQSSSYSVGEIVATAVSYDASENSYAIVCEENNETANVILDKDAGSKLFITPIAKSSRIFAGYDRESATSKANKEAIAYITQELLNFDYEGI